MTITNLSTEPTLQTKAQNPTMTNGHVKIHEPEITELQCPKCRAENVGRKLHIWRVADERGVHYECSVCAHAWTI